jgi:hypothetical protein
LVTFADALAMLEVANAGESGSVLSAALAG